jgi:hypothetical protein
MQTKTLTVQDFKTEEQTRKILAQVKKAWREARKNAKLPFADYTRDFIVRINRLMRMGEWELAIDWILDLNDYHIPGTLQFPRIACSTDQPFLWFLVYSSELKDQDYWEGLFIAAYLEKDFYSIPLKWWKRAFNNETNAGKYDSISEEEWMSILQSHPEYNLQECA